MNGASSKFQGTVAALSCAKNIRHTFSWLTGHGHLVVATATQCCIYSLASLNTPHILDLKETPTLIMHADRYIFLLAFHLDRHSVSLALSLALVGSISALQLSVSIQ